MRYEYHHMGILTTEKWDGERYIPEFKMYSSGYEGSEFRILWHRFEPDCLNGPPEESYAGEQGVACEELPGGGTASEGTATCDDFISLAGYPSQYQAQQ